MSFSGDRESLSAPLLDEPDIIHHDLSIKSPSPSSSISLSSISGSIWRQWIYFHIVSTKWFQMYILVTIIADLCIIAIDSMLAQSYRSIHFIFLTLFTFEILVKMIAFGLIYRITKHQIPFFRHPYHIFDFLIIICSWFTLFQFDITGTALRIIFIIFFIPILEVATMTI